ncbi:uncharacterized protein K452DRAFT_282341 [Aplosporella prunicola CBS 121167]|uniref:Uncharacterized protein n=1 Tax=Aplosporella prunicola CBS 121167 TaxID=1176127 RepID=A0A6A6BVN4_9PEZI|nr:uncharacterized protein K452DRAFT_282341 [Aplosporella prunicola CBS 121167]KAF2147335.1 hypothetical protein K452DRAFT_282341 [Aplosporella prunicola CBS 121167]
MEIRRHDTALFLLRPGPLALLALPILLLCPITLPRQLPTRLSDTRVTAYRTPFCW